MKKKILDIMIDFETFGRQPNSVPINLAVVAWNRYAEENPFVIPGVKQMGLYPGGSSKLPNMDCDEFTQPMLNHSRFFVFHFDVCTCLMEGMTVERETQEWWQKQSSDAKKAAYFSSRTQMSPYAVVGSFAEWLTALREETGAEEVCIWSQGSDFDIAKLRWLVDQYSDAITSVNRPIFSHTSLRDARTVTLELGNKLYNGKRGFSVDLKTNTIVTDGQPNQKEELSEFSDIYDRMPSIESWATSLQKQEGIATGAEGVMSNYLFDLALGCHPHNSIYDCMRSIYNVWWLNKALDTQMI